MLIQRDEDGNGIVDGREFRQALPMLGIKLPKEKAVALFKTFDVDDSGAIDYTELHKQLRPGQGGCAATIVAPTIVDRPQQHHVRLSDVDIDEILRAGAAGEIALHAKNNTELRGKLNGDTSLFGEANLIDMQSDTPIMEQLAYVMGNRLVRVIDIFRAWDEDSSGTVSKREFGKVLPLLGGSATCRHLRDCVLLSP